MYKVQLYKPEEFSVWNDFVSQAKNATFLFHRDYMDYHKDRFDDYSVMVFNSKDKLVAIVPANRVENHLYSHQGLTYGGVVVKSTIKLDEYIAVLKAILFFLDKNGIHTFYLKTIPEFYCEVPSQEIDYCLHKLEAEKYRCDVLSVVDITNFEIQNRKRRREINRGFENELMVKETKDFSGFWNQLLIPNLLEKHETQPVHSLDEINLLQSKFPNNIKQYNVYKEGTILGGITIFEINNVIHPQYIAGNKETDKLYGTLEFLIYYLVSVTYKDKKWFDLASSNGDNQKTIKQNLLFFKESFGARTFVQNFHQISTKNYTKLESILI